MSLRVWYQERSRYLSLVWMLVRRELKVKYRGTVLGYLWSMLNPLLFMLIVSFVFRQFMKGVENYNLYVLSGILFWNVGSQTINMGATSIINNAGLLRKVRVPIWIFPMVPLGSTITNFLLALLPYTLIFLWSGRTAPQHSYLLLMVIPLYALFLYGIALILSVLNVFFRDVAHVLEPILNLMFYATPIIYIRDSSMLPNYVSDLLLLNPFTHFIEGFRIAVFGGDLPSALRLSVLVFLPLLTLSLGAVLYKILRRRILFHV